MGITHIEGTVVGPRGKTARVQFLIDSGAVYSLLPQRVWRSIELKPRRTLQFRLADGSPITRKVSECEFKLKEGRAHSPVVLGEANDGALLGVVTLENLGLVFNPFERKLQPMEMLLV